MTDQPHDAKGVASLIRETKDQGMKYWEILATARCCPACPAAGRLGLKLNGVIAEWVADEIEAQVNAGEELDASPLIQALGYFAGNMACTLTRDKLEVMNALRAGAHKGFEGLIAAAEVGMVRKVDVVSEARGGGNDGR